MRRFSLRRRPLRSRLRRVRRRSFKRTSGRRRLYSRRRSYRRTLRAPTPKYLTITKKSRVGDFIPMLAAGLETFSNTTWSLSSVPDYQKYVAMWGEFRFNWIKEVFVNLDNLNTANTALYKGTCYEAVIPDGDWPASLAELSQRKGAREHFQPKGWTRVFRPTSRYVQDVGVLSNNYGYKQGQWHQTLTDQDKPHFGYSFGMHAPAVGPAPPLQEWTRYEHWITYSVSFRNPKQII